MSFYPDIKIPAPLERAYRSEPVLANFDSSKPPQIAIAPQRFHLIALAVEAGLIALASSICWPLYGFTASAAIFIGGAILNAGHAMLMHLTYPERWYLYHEQVDRLRRQLWESEFHQARAERLQTTDGITRYRRQKALAVLAHTTPAAKTTGCTAIPLSLAATQFAPVLDHWFPHKISTHAGITLHDTESNLHIAIEVDEPYHQIDGEIQVAHYAGASADRQYNQFCLQQGWVVIRFSAQQVADHADSCCKVIAEVTSELLQDPSWLAPFAEVDELIAVPQWTEIEAHRLAKIAQRQYA